ncbi:MAG: hypothetical protein NVSMB55_02810 [Mycobacteriales bacterium]
MPDPTPSPGGDWAFPPVEPAPPVRPQHELPPSAPAAAPSAARAHWAPSSVVPSLDTGPASAAPAGTAPGAAVMPVARRQPSTASPVSPLRAIAGAAVAVAGVLLGIGALLWATDAPNGAPTVTQAPTRGSALSAPSAASSAISSPSPSPVASGAGPAAVALASPATTAAASPPAASKPALTVLNNSNRTGLAKRAAARYAAAGWPITLTGSFRGRVSESTVYYAPGQQPSALALQQAFPALTRVRPRFAGLPGSGLTVVLVRTYPA